MFQNLILFIVESVSSTMKQTSISGFCIDVSPEKVESDTVKWQQKVNGGGGLTVVLC